MFCICDFEFQSTHPHGVRHFVSRRTKRKTDFNPRTHTGCDYRNNKRLRDFFYFNPRTHTGCDGSDQIKNRRFFYFNPRTHTGCDATMSNIYCNKNKFQSTHPHGVRRKYVVSQTDTADISIHAPTRGATHSVAFSSASFHFNPRTHTGCDELQEGLTSSLLNFNPRTHTGCDKRSVKDGRKQSISIHAPTRGATIKIS